MEKRDIQMRYGEKRIIYLLLLTGISIMISLPFLPEASKNNTSPHFYTESEVFPADLPSIEFTLISPNNFSEIQPGSTIQVSYTNSSNIIGIWYQWNHAEMHDFLGIPIATDSLNDGIHTLSLIGNTTDGNSTQIEYHFLIDSIKPYVTIENHNSGDYIRSGEGLSLQLWENNTITHYFYNWDGITNHNLDLIEENDIVCIDLSEGLHYLNVFSRDAAGNTNHQEFEFRMDSSAPIIEKISPEILEFQTNEVLNLTCQDNYQLAYLEYNLGEETNQTISLFDKFQEISIALPYDVNKDYELELFLFDEAGNMHYQTEIITIDTKPSNIFLYSHEENAVINQIEPIEIKVQEPNTLKILTYNWDQIENATILRESIPSDGIITIQAENLQDGIHTLHFWTQDAAGNQNYTTFNLKFDSQTPSISLINPSNNSIIHANQKINFTVGDLNTINEVSIQWDSNGLISLGIQENYSYSIPSLSEGLHFFSIRANDIAGNQKLKTYHFLFDEAPPIISYTGPMEVKPGSTIQLSISDSSSLNNVLTNWDGGANRTLINPYRCEIPYLMDGNHTVHIFAYDVQGLESEASFEFIIDSTAPNLNVNKSLEEKLLSANDLIEIDFFESNSLDSIWYNFNNQENISVNSPYILTIDSEMHGNYQLEIFIADLAGNINSSIYEVIIDNQAPNITLLTSEYVQSNEILEFSIGDEYSYVNAHFQWDSGFLEEFENNFTIPILNLSEGYHNLIVFANDSRNNQKVENYLILVDNTAPEIQLISANETKPANQIEIQISDSSPILNRTYKWNEDNFYPWDGETPIYVPDFSEGIQNFTMNVYDHPGNMHSQTFNVLIDLHTPIIDLINPNNNTVLHLSDKFELSIEDDNSLQYQKYQWDFSDWIDIAEDGIILPDLSMEGRHTLTIFAQDVAKNQKIVNYTFLIDLTAPSISLLNDTYIKPEDFIYLEINDENGIDNVIYNWNGGWNTTLGDPYLIEIPNLTERTHYLHVYATDTLGNIQYQIIEMNIDLTSPTIHTIDSNLPDTIHFGTILTFEFTDNLAIGNKFYTWNEINWISINQQNAITVNHTITGNCTLSLRVEDLAGNYNTANFTFFSDNSPPELMMPNQTEIKSNTTLLFLMDDDSVISHIYLGKNINSMDAIPYYGNSQFNFTVTDTLDGSYSMYIQLWDNQLNNQIYQFNYTVDNIAPFCELVSNEVAASNSSLRVQIWESNTLSNCIIHWPNGVNESITGYFGNYIDIMIPVLTEDSYNLSFNLVDEAGNHQESTIQIEIDDTAPTITFNEEQWQIAQKEGNELPFVSFDKNEITKILVFWDSIDMNFTVEVEENLLIIPALPEGINQGIIILEDIAGNKRNVTFEILIDESNPQIVFLTALENNIIKSNFTLEISIIDNSDVDIIYAWESLDNSTTWISNKDTPIIAPLEEGLRILYIMAIDEAGNDILNNYSFYIDNTPPSISLISPTTSSKLKGGTELTFMVLDNSGIQNMSYSWDDGDFLPLSDTGKITLPEKYGYHIVKIIATDFAGNNITITFEYRTEMKTITKISISFGIITSTVSIGIIFLLKQKSIIHRDKQLKKWLQQEGFKL